MAPASATNSSSAADVAVVVASAGYRFAHRHTKRTHGYGNTAAAHAYSGSAHAHSSHADALTHPVYADAHGSTQYRILWRARLAGSE